jgi:hypothetical protein
MSQEADVFAYVNSLDEIHRALRLRFDDLDLSRVTIGAAAGVADGYAERLLSDPPTKRFGDATLWPVLQVAGLRLALVEAPEALARTAALPKRDRRHVRHQLLMAATRARFACQEVA